MRLREGAAGAMALWQMMTMTGPSAPPPAAPVAPSSEAVAAWHRMTMTGPFAAPSGAVIAPQAPGGTVGRYEAPIMLSPALLPTPTTPLRDQPTQVPQAKPSTGDAAARPGVTDDEAIRAADGDPAQARQQQQEPLPADANRSLTIDEKRFVQNNALLDAGYSQGHAVAPHLAAAGMVPIQGDATNGGIRLNGYRLAVAESFDSGKGLFSNTWGKGVDLSVPGQITVRRVGDDTDSGAMVPAAGREAGFGYGLYTFDLKFTGDANGGYALGWPSTDQWPGPEFDLVERHNGRPYSTLHWNNNGQDAYASQFADVDMNQRRTWQFLWEPGRIRSYVDGKQFGEWTGPNVPRSAADGGENMSPGIGMQTWRFVNQQGGENSVTIYGFSHETPR